jgi:alkylation response protein AidB-like acyl-CoA dehydrogenase
MTVEIDLGPEIAQFRAELREWIAAEAPEELAGLADWNMHVATGGNLSATLQAAQGHPAYREWERKLLGRRLICAGWPEEYGGGGLDPVRQTVVKQEFFRAGLPAVTRGGGESLVGPSVIAHGTPEQKAHFLPRILSGEHVYCQGFSEPNHGSDLAAVDTRGVVDGDEIVITGQKVWTSGAEDANMMFALCRTDPAVPKHAGLSYVLFDFTDPAVTVRPIRQISGSSEFAEDFFDGVRAPLFNVIGALGDGWRVAMTTLGFERGSSATVQYLGFEKEYWELVETARKHGKTADPLVRQQLAWAYTQVQLMKYTGLRTLAQLAAGKQPGPEASLVKLFWSEYWRKVGEIAVGIGGSESMLRPQGDNYPTDHWQDVFLASRAGTIYAGSNEIQRNIIGERVLGLPKEPRLA